MRLSHACLDVHVYIRVRKEVVQWETSKRIGAEQKWFWTVADPGSVIKGGWGMIIFFFSFVLPFFSSSSYSFLSLFPPFPYSPFFLLHFSPFPSSPFLSSSLLRVRRRREGGPQAPLDRHWLRNDFHFVLEKLVYFPKKINLFSLLCVHRRRDFHFLKKKSLFFLRK